MQDVDPTGRPFAELLSQLADARVWGGALQIALAAQLWGVEIRVRPTHYPTHTFGSSSHFYFDDRKPLAFIKIPI